MQAQLRSVKWTRRQVSGDEFVGEFIEIGIGILRPNISERGERDAGEQKNEARDFHGGILEALDRLVMLSAGAMSAVIENARSVIGKISGMSDNRSRSQLKSIS